jgi:hypothetical protein
MSGEFLAEFGGFDYTTTLIIVRLLIVTWYSKYKYIFK